MTDGSNTPPLASMLSRRFLLGSIAAIATLPQAGLAQASKVDVPFKLNAGRVLLDVSLNGGPSLPFLLDTGGVVSLIRRDVAKAAGLTRVGTLRLGTVGGYGGLDPRDGYVAREVLIGGMARRDSVQFAAVDADGIELGASGSLNGELLTTYDSLLSFGDLTWSIYLSGQPDHAGFSHVPSQIRQPAKRGAPFLYVDAELDGRPLRLLVDTGAPRSIILQSNAAKRLGLTADDRPWAPWRVRGGDAPGAMGRATRADRLVMAGQTFSRPLVNLRSNAPVADLADGLLGLGIIRRLDWIIDRNPGTLWVKPNGREGAVDQYVRSGLGLERDGGGATVTQIGFGSPAARAGFRIGDRITGPQVVTLLRESAEDVGKTLQLDVMREGRIEHLSLSPENYL